MYLYHTVRIQIASPIAPQAIPVHLEFLKAYAIIVA